MACLWELGRPFFERYGKYFLFDQKQLQKVNRFWEQHGEASTFTGRLAPGVRQPISIPAGVALPIGGYLALAWWRKRKA
jgi:membrane protein DedA with SNARE-associated domain